MYTLVLYDISCDKRRTAVSEACKDYGLQRIQWSAFSGRLNRNRREELMHRLADILGDEVGNIRLYIMCEKDVRLMQEIDVSN